MIISQQSGSAMSLDRSATAILLVCFLSLTLGGCDRGSQSLPPSTQTVGASPKTDDNPSSPQTQPDTSGFGPRLVLTRYDRLFSIIVGIDEYSAEESDLDPLQFAVNDARELRDVLQQEFGFASEHCKYLTNKAATKSALIEALQSWLPDQKLKANDALLVFFAGHGVIDRRTKAGDGYLATVDSRRDDFERSGLPVSWLAERLKELPCRHKLLILDSCYSGSLFQQRVATAPNSAEPERTSASPSRTAPSEQSSSNDRPERTTSSSDLFSYYFSQPSFVGMSAGRFTPVYDGLGANRHSIFTAALIEELRNRADSDRADQSFTFRELATRTETRVREVPGSKQIPDWGQLSPGDGDFVFQPTERRVTPRAKKRQTEYTRLIAQAEDEIQQQHFEETLAILERCPSDLRAWEWGYLRNRLGEVLQLVDGDMPIVINADETIAACRSYKDKNNILIFALSDGKALHVLKGHKSPVAALTFTPDGKYLVSGSGDRKTLGNGFSVLQANEMKLPPLEREKLLATRLPSEIITWDYHTGERLSSADCEGFQVRNLAFDATGTRIGAVLTTSHDRDPNRRTKAKFIKRESGEEIFMIDSRTGTGMTTGTWMILGTAFPNEPNTLAILLERQSPPPNATKNVTQYYDEHTGQRSTIVSTPAAGLPTFNINNGQGLARSEFDVRSRPVGSPQEIRIRTKKRAPAMSAITVLPEDRRATQSLGLDRVILLEDGRLVADEQPRPFFKDHSLFTIWEAKSGRLLIALPKQILPTGSLEGPPKQVVDVAKTKVVQACTRNGRLAAMTTGDINGIQQLEIVETASGRVTQQFEGNFRPLVAVEFSADASLIAMSGTPEEQYRQFIEPALREKSRSVPGVPGETRIWDVQTGRLKTVLPRSTSGMIFSPDGRSVRLGSIFKFDFCDIETGATKRVFQWTRESSLTLHHVLQTTQFSPDGKFIAGSINGTVKLWSVQSDQEPLSVQGDANRVEMLCFDHSSKRMATVGAGNDHRDRMVRIWDTMTGDLVNKLGIPKEVAYSFGKRDDDILMFANEGRTLMLLGGLGSREIITWTASNWAPRVTE